MTSRKASQNAHLQHAGGRFDALFQAFSQEFIEVLVQFLLCRGQFLFSLFCPGSVVGQFLFGHLDHFVQFCRLGAAFDFSVSYNGGRVFGVFPFFFCHGEAAWEIGVTGTDFSVNGLGVLIGEVPGSDIMGPGVGNDFTGEVMAHAEGDAVVFHELIGNFLGTGPVQVQLFKGTGRVDDQVVQNFIHGGEDFGGLGHDVPGAAQAAVSHAGGNIMGAEHGFHRHAEKGGCVGAAAVQKARISFLGHGRGYVGIAAAFFQYDPGAGLGVLLHDFFNEAGGVDGDAVGDAAGFDGRFLGENLAGIVGVVGDGVKSKVFCHAVSVQWPAGTVQHGASHGRAVEAFVIFPHPLHVTAIGVGIGDEIVGQAVGLGGYAIGVVGDEGILIFFCQTDEVFLHLIQLFRHGEKVFPLFHNAYGGEHVLGRAAGMDFRDIGACSFDEIGLKGNHIMGPCRAGQISIPEDLINAFGKGMALFRREKAFVGIDDIGGFIDLPQPVEIISWRLGSKYGARGNQGAEGKGKYRFLHGITSFLILYTYPKMNRKVELHY